MRLEERTLLLPTRYNCKQSCCAQSKYSDRLLSYRVLSGFSGVIAIEEVRRRKALMLLCSVPCGKLAATEGDSNPSKPVSTQQRERGGKYPYSIKVVGKERRHSQREILPSTLEPFLVRRNLACSKKTQSQIRCPCDRTHSMLYRIVTS